MSIPIKDIDDLKTRLTKAGDKLVVINFMAAWCTGTCKSIECEEIANEMADAYVALTGKKFYFFFALVRHNDGLLSKRSEKYFSSKSFIVLVDLDECPDIFGAYNVTELPTFIFFKNTKKIEDVLKNNILMLK